MLLLDTCTLLWWTLDPDRLSDPAREACNEIEKRGAYISSITIWEIGIKIKKKTLYIGEDVASFLRRLQLLGSIEIIPVDANLWVKNLSLDWEHKDPADRTIVATAMVHKLPIVTKDDIIRNFYTKTIW